MTVATLPPPVDISAEQKKTVIDGLKKVIEILQAKGSLDKALTYQAVIDDPAALKKFCEVFRANRQLCDAVVVGADKKPVRNDDAPLVCGVSLNQIVQLLVKTVAKRFYDKDKVEEEPVLETVTTKRFIFFTKTETVEKKQGGGADERKLREMLKYVAFDWQLELLVAYRDHLLYQHILELGPDLLALTTPEAVAELGKLDAALIKKAKENAGRDFINLLAHPAAIPGAAQWSKDMYMFYRNVLGDSAWGFFMRDKSFFMVVAALDKPVARVYGDMLCYIASENLQEMQRLNIDKTDVLVGALKAAFGDNAPAVLSMPGFAKDILRKLVESLLHMSQEKEQLAVATQLTCKAIVPNVIDWLGKQRANA